MSRTAYHRAYYYANVERRRASARAARRKAREWQAVVRIVSDAVTEARNEKSPLVGSEDLTRPGKGLTLKLRIERDGSLTDCSSPVNHPTTLNARCWENSHRPVGEERGVALKSVQRPPIYGHAAHCREACEANGETRQKLPTPSEAPKGS